MSVARRQTLETRELPAVQSLRRRRLLAACRVLSLLLLPGLAAAQPLPQDDPPEEARLPGEMWKFFGPWNADGAFFEITQNVEDSFLPHALAVDPRQRLLVLADWHDILGSGLTDCAVTRHLLNARTLDMDFGNGLEATEHIALDFGGANQDRCQALAVDAFARPVVAGYASTSIAPTGFVVRLRESDGDFDTTFSNDGKLPLAAFVPFQGIETRLEDVAAYQDGRILACGYSVRATERHMLVVRLTATGTLDTSFAGTGFRELDFTTATGDSDSCSRIRLLPDQRIALAGNARDASGNSGYAVARLTANGGDDNSFSGDGRVVFTGGSALTTVAVSDLDYDAGHDRLLVAATLISALNDSGALLAVDGTGALDPAFHGTGKRVFRFSEIGGAGNPRDTGATELHRVVVERDGALYAVGTHTNSSADAATYGDTDVAVARIGADGEDDASFGFGTAGVAFYASALSGPPAVTPADERLRVSDALADAVVYRGNLVLLSFTNRHPAGTWGNTNYPDGQLAPLLTGIVTGRIWNRDWEYDGLPAPTTSYDAIPVPAGYGRYCSARNVLTGVSFLLAQGAASDPCTQLTQPDPLRSVQRSGIYDLSGTNFVLAACDGDFVAKASGLGSAPFTAAVSLASGHTGCDFTAAPYNLPIFDRPYTGAHPASLGQSFNHDVYGLAIDVGEFGQTPLAGHPLAHFIDVFGAQKCDAVHGHTPGNGPIGGVDEPASDLFVGSDRLVLAVADGRVESAVPRFVLNAIPVGNDPWQREVFVRHTVGSGLYSEELTSYYAHMSGLLVRRGEAIAQGDWLGIAGETGAASGVHLHFGLARNRNLNFRRYWEPDYPYLALRVASTPAAVDAWGWRASQGFDPWAWRFGTTDDSGSWSIYLWNPGEEPPIN